MLRDLVSHASANATAIDQLLVLTENNNVSAQENTQAIAQNRHDMLEFNRVIFESRPNQATQAGRDNSAVNLLMQASIGNFFPAWVQNNEITKWQIETKTMIWWIVKWEGILLLNAFYYLFLADALASKIAEAPIEVKSEEAQ